MKHIILLALVGANLRCCDSAYRDVSTNQGVVRGYDDDDAEVFSFYGIPYATTPKGPDQFKEALPPPTWTTVFNATDRYTICPQKQMESDKYFELNRAIDCLNVNIFVPQTNQSDLPVWFNIHGGGYVNGYGMQTSPINIVKKGLIAVTFNYRLGVHGFLCLGTELAPGNAGLKDQTKALDWVRNNIRNFGGDPEQITIAGSSAGSFSVEFFLLSNLTKGMYSKAICDSGSAQASVAIADDPIGDAEIFANYFGAPAENNLELLESFFSLVTEEQLNADVSLTFWPCVENHNLSGVQKFLEDTPKNILNKGEQSKVPLLSGFTTSEGVEMLRNYQSQKLQMEENFIAFLPGNIEYNEYSELEDIAVKLKSFYFPTGEITEDGFVFYYTDMTFNYPQYVFAREHSGTVSSVFFHVFDFKGTVKLPTNLPTTTGSGHVAQTLYVLDYDINWIYDNMTAEDYSVQEELREFYVNFCKTGNPSTSTFNWPPFDEEHKYYMYMDGAATLQQSPSREAFELWDSIYNYNTKVSSADKTVALTATIVATLTFLSFL